jgi:ribosomal protein S18 acetylase RimI-like enzyme
MTPVGATSEVFEAIQKVKAGAPAFCTNFFPVEKKLQAWIEHGELSAELCGQAAFFFRKDRDFQHFYFCAADAASFAREIGVLPELKAEKLATDLVGNEAALAELLAALEGAGFRRLTRLQRMARVNKPHAFQAPPGEAQVIFAEKTDSAAVLELLDASFNRYADQLPLPYEIEAAIEGRQIVVVKSGGKLAALLFFETQGFTSTVRYWAVAGAFRSLRLGSVLMRHYFETHAAVRRFNLWVESGNQNAIQKYEHYGYAADGLIDHVLVNGMIHA